MKLSSLVSNVSKAASGQVSREDPLKAIHEIFDGDDPFALATLPKRLGRFDAAKIIRCIDLLARIMADRGSDATGASACGLARRLALSLTDRRRAVAATVRLSSQDRDFMDLVHRADGYRDSGNWSDGELHYWKLLSLYPLHPGYRVQYAHCLKEQGKFADAELQYRNTLAAGNLDPDLIRHLQFVAGRSNRSVSQGAMDAITGYWAGAGPDVSPLCVPATERDILLASDLLLGRTAWSVAQLSVMIDAAPLMSDVVAHLVELPEFSSANRDLLCLLVETGRTSP